MATLLARVDAGVSLHEGFQLETDKAALLIVDVQEHIWLENTAHDHFCNTFHQGLEKIRTLTKEFRHVRDDEISPHGCEVIFTYYQSLTRDGRDVALDLKLSGQRFRNIPGPEASNLYLEQCRPNKTTGKGDITIPKTSSSVFQSTNIDYVLRNLGIEQIVISGHLTDRGVEAAVRDAADLGYFVTVAEDACTAKTSAQHDLAIRNMRQHARIKSADSIAQEVRADFAKKKAATAATTAARASSVLEKSVVSDNEGAATAAYVLFLRSQGFEEAAEKVERHFVPNKAGFGSLSPSRTDGVSLAFGSTNRIDTSLEYNHVASPDVPTLHDMTENDDPENLKVYEGSSSSFLTIENEDESILLCGKLADGCATQDLLSHDPSNVETMATDMPADSEVVPDSMTSTNHHRTVGFAMNDSVTHDPLRVETMVRDTAADAEVDPDFIASTNLHLADGCAMNVSVTPNPSLVETMVKDIAADSAEVGSESMSSTNIHMTHETRPKTSSTDAVVGSSGVDDNITTPLENESSSYNNDEQCDEMPMQHARTCGSHADSLDQYEDASVHQAPPKHESHADSPVQYEEEPVHHAQPQVESHAGLGAITKSIDCGIDFAGSSLIPDGNSSEGAKLGSNVPDLPNSSSNTMESMETNEETSKDLQQTSRDGSFESFGFRSQPDHSFELAGETNMLGSVGAAREVPSSPSPSERPNSMSLSNRESASSITEAEVHADQRPNHEEFTSPSSLSDLGLDRPPPIPEHEESASGGFACQFMSRLSRRRQKDPPANRFESESFIGDPRARR